MIKVALMKSIDFETLLITMYVLVDDWYQAEAKHFRAGQPGCKPVFSDSEVLTLVLAMEFLPFPGETQFLGYLRANYLEWFPKLLDASQFNRRARALREVLEPLRWHWLKQMGVEWERQLLLDTKPVPIVGYKRDKSHSEFLGSAAYGYCASRNLHYFGYKLVSVMTLDGVVVRYDVVAANTDERVAAEAVLESFWGCDIFADKGFLSETWQEELNELSGNRLWTPKRANQTEQQPKAFERLLNRVRERIEGGFNELQNTGRHLERLLSKTIDGLATQVAAKLTSQTLKYYLRRFFGIDVQTFQVAVNG
jgi:hypothetical protein